MVSVLDVAKYILLAKGVMSTWKLQKLCYYAQAWHYTWTEERLIKEDFQAWRNGPVCPELFAEHRGRFLIAAEDFHVGDPDSMTADEKDSVDVVLRDYGDRTPYELREQTHFEEPWKKARAGLPEDVNCQNVISLESMGEYYGGLLYG